jgi:FAD/FMN-containing dehydrogenase/Fe-S oxidoreductase
VESVVRALRAGMRGAVADDAATRAAYSADASNYRHVPLAVAFPRDGQDAAEAMAACAAHGVPVTCRGGGTSVGGQACGDGVLLDFSRHMSRVLAIDPAARTARVQPGVVLDDLQAAAAGHGLAFGPDPSTHSRCTLGGMLGNNSCGAHSVRYGTTGDSTVDLDVLLADGTRLAALSTVDSAGPLAAPLHAFVRRHLAVLRTGLPELPRRTSGYDLDALLPERGGNLARALVGTEGSCVSVLAATVRLVRPPAARALAVLGYPDPFRAADATPPLLVHHPLAVEGIDAALVAAATGPAGRAGAAPAGRAGAGPAGGPRGLLPPGGAWLYCETGGDTAGEASRAARELARAAGVPSLVVTDPAQQRALWRLREDGAGLATRLAGGAEAYPGWEDAAVPPQRLGGYLREFAALLAGYRLRGVYYGHFGAGCVHVRLDFDLVSRPGIAAFRSFCQDAADLVVAHGGSLSGEHGDGQARGELLARMYPAPVLRAFEEFKALFDPAGLLNPGAGVRPRRLDADLRWATPPAGRTAFSYPHDGGDLAAALRRCVGVGACRGDSAAVMCPSWRATRDERHSTRGRARVLLEMLRGDGPVRGGWRSAAVRDVLDLCLSCKGCRSDCPVNVDMATYKAEFLYHHYRWRPRPAAHYALGWLPVWARLAGLAPGAVNAALRRRLLAGLARRLGGLAPERALPAFAPVPFPGRLPGGSPPAPTRPVVLFVDTFTRYFAPQVGVAAVRVLRAAGFEVRLPPGGLCCGLTWVSTGQLGVARRVMRRTVRLLAPHVAAGVPVVGLEPSCTAALRSDLPELLPAAAPLAAAVRTMAEVLAGTDLAGWLPPGALAGRTAAGQVHCHQRSVLGTAADAALLAHLGADWRLCDGCCGLAGNFGFERGHYGVSQAVAADRLYPALLAAPPGAVLLADGFSCRTQIAQGTGRQARHLAELLADLLPPGAGTPAPPAER